MILKNKNIILIVSRNIALITIFFIVIISFLLIFNYIQIKRIKPVENNSIELLIKKLNQNPEDENLKEQIREIDLLSRKVFFTNQWQLHYGAYFLLINFILFFVSFLVYKSLINKPLKFNKDVKKINFWEIKSKERNLLIFSFFTIFIGALFSAYLANENYTDFEVINESKKTNNLLNTTNINNKQAEIYDKKNNKIINQHTDSNKNNDTINLSINKPSITEFPSDNVIRQNFPAFRGPFGLGICYNKNIPTEWDGVSGKNIKWKIQLNLPGLNSPIIWGKYLFAAGANAQNREVYCVDRITGEILWAKLAENIPGSPAVSPRVTDDTGYSASTLTTDGLYVYAIFSNGDLICFDFKGNKIWAKNIGVPTNHYGHSSSLLLFHDLLLIQFDNNKTRNLIALYAKTGDIKWNTSRKGKISWSSPILINNNNNYEVILNNDPYVASYNPITGEELWKIESLTGEIGASPAYSNGIVFSANAYAKLAAVKISNPPTVVWENSDYLPDVSSPVAWNDYLFISTSAGELACYSTKDGTLHWMHEFDNGFYSSPIIAENKVFILDRNGIMHIVDANKEFKIINESKIGEKSDCTPAFADGFIYLRTKKSLFCIGK